MIAIARGVHERFDWVAIRAEYVAGGTSYRRLAKKYGVSETSLGKRARAEGWVKDREEARRRSCENAIRKAADIAAENAVQAQRIKTRLLERLSALTEMALSGTENRSYDLDGRLIEIRRLKDLTGAYKDLTGGLFVGDAGDDAIARARDVLEGLESAIE